MYFYAIRKSHDICLLITRNIGVRHKFEAYQLPFNAEEKIYILYNITNVIFYNRVPLPHVSLYS